MNLFNAWHWSKLVIKVLKEDLNPETLAIDHDGDVESGYRSCLHFLAHQGPLAQSRFRVNALVDSNPNFPQQLRTVPIEEVIFVPSRSDVNAWVALTCLAQQGYLHWSKATLSSNRTFDVFKSIYSYQHRLRSLARSDHASRVLNAIRDCWEVERAQDNDHASAIWSPSHIRHPQYVFRSKQDGLLEVSWLNLFHRDQCAHVS